MLRILFSTLTVASILLAANTHADNLQPPEGYSKMLTNYTALWQSNTGKLTVKISTGCVATHPSRFTKENVGLAFDKQAKELRINGSYIGKTITKKPLFTTADCMGSRYKTYEFFDVPQGSYKVVLNGETGRTLTLDAADIKKPVDLTRDTTKQSANAKRFIKETVGKLIADPRLLGGRGRLSLSWNPAAQMVSFLIRPFCLTSSAKNLTSNFSTQLDSDSNKIHVDGFFQYTLNSKYVKRDCRPVQPETLTLKNIKPGDYKIVQNGVEVMVLSLGNEPITISPDYRRYHGKKIFPVSRKK
ncbi:hypothetical protein [Labrenzia sp. CE80]|uniref:hypothetical protein n=1 Tax=Labrenzia sp. CE80 TaxID=1788986 RepID=UPI00129A50A5|nr:hypothetical protein [Labrenzia sp. CE80]